jgi:hypothetical protein
VPGLCRPRLCTLAAELKLDANGAARDGDGRGQ